MAKIKLTKTAVDAATPQERDYELRDTTIPGFLVKVTPAGRKTFMIAYVTNSGQRRKPAIGRYGEITVEQARGIAQDWLAEVRRGGDPSAERTATRQAPTVKELFDRFITDYSEGRNKPSTVQSNRERGKRHLIPKLGQLKVGFAQVGMQTHSRGRRCRQLAYGGPRIAVAICWNSASLIVRTTRMPRLPTGTLSRDLVVAGHLEIAPPRMAALGADRAFPIGHR